MEQTTNDTARRRPRMSVGAIVRHFGGVLLVKTGEGAAARWCLPRVEQHWRESLLQATERATLEQAGVQVKAGDIFQVYDLIDDSDDDHVIMLDFEAVYVDGDLDPGAGVLDVAWASGLALRSMEVEENTAELLADIGIL